MTWREMRKKGFRGQIGVVSEWARRRRLAERTDQSALARTPSARSIAKLMTLARDDLSKSDAVLIGAIESNVPDLGHRANADRRLSADDPIKGGRKTGHSAGRREGKPRRLLCKQGRKGHRRSPQRHHLFVVEWLDRRPDHQAQTHQAANVRPRQD
ncbi:hypothetical protein NKI79_17995 [Mesorhizobium sp. M0340]|uniref:hypothetical protein n=1 Tax=Mesorhizobium sp. M0340 TaxID=2956939 RepID=UPI0033368C52